jgi:uncharacterized protein
MSKVSIKRAAQRAVTEDRRARQEQARRRTDDSFQNFALGLGIGTNNTSSANTYGFNPITRIRTELEWMYRGAWLAGAAVDVIANDMTREGVEITGQLDPDEIEEIEEEAVTLRVWERINQTIKWSRLYGGCIWVLLLDGQDYSTPLRVDRVGPNQFKGLLVLDRWMAMPSLEDLVTEIGPDLGLPKFYTVDVSAPALRGKKIHYSRCIRLIGDELPYWQAMGENLWGMSVLERPFPIVSQFDSATAGASQMVSKAYLRYFKVKNYRSILSTGGPAKKGLQEMVAAMRLFASNEGISLIDAEDDMVTAQASVFSGMSEILLHIAEQIAGAFGIPLVRLLGQSPGGLGSNGDGEIKTYKDGIRQKQQYIRVGVTKIYRCLARSLSIDVEKGYIVKFRALEQIDETTKSDIADKDTRSAVAVLETGKISDKTFLQEVARTSAMTGRWNSITKEVIDSSSDELPPDPSEMEELPPPPAPEKKPAPGKTGDSARWIPLELDLQGLAIAIENPKGMLRTGPGWQITMPADYGYIKGVMGADGDELDCYVGPDRESNKVFVVDQLTFGGESFDEHKCMVGFNSAAEAIKAYMAGHHRSGEVFGEMTEMSMREFASWCAGGDRKMPVSWEPVPVCVSCQGGDCLMHERVSA